MARKETASENNLYIELYQLTKKSFSDFTPEDCLDWLEWEINCSNPNDIFYSRNRHGWMFIYFDIKNSKFCFSCFGKTKLEAGLRAILVISKEKVHQCL
jgi:hypothetical protein